MTFSLPPECTDIRYEDALTHTHIEKSALLSGIEKLKNSGFTLLLDITAIDYTLYPKPHPENFAVVYLFRSHDFSHAIALKCYLAPDGLTIPSIIHLYPCADWLERETYDQYGIVFKGHPNLERVLNHHEFIGHPLRKDYPITQAQHCTSVVDLMPQMQRRLAEKKIITQNSDGSYTDPNRDLMFLNIGPSHPASHGTIRSFVALEGENIVAAVSEIGYLHRGFEKSCENHTYNQIIPYTDRLNYCSSLTNNVAFAKAIEEMLGVTLPERGIYIRILLIELSRVLDHLICLAANLVDMGALTNFWYLFNPREDAYTFLSRLTGARLTNSYMRVGGMSADLYSGYEHDLEIILRNIEKGVSESLKLIEHNRIFLDRTQNVGIVTAEEALKYGFSGPNLRASGVMHDQRKNTPYYFYDRFEFDSPIGSVGDIYDRIMVRYAEIAESLKIVRQCMAQMPGGPISVSNPSIILPPKKAVFNSIEGAMNQFKLIFEGVKVPAKEHYSCLEATNGELGFYIVSDGSGTPYKVKVRAPSFIHMAAYPSMIEDEQLADAIINLGSINIIAGEMDR